MSIIDTHAHLDQVENLEEALIQASKVGVEGIVAVSMDFQSCQNNLAIKKKVKDPKIFLAMGIHPEKAQEDELEKTIQLAREHAKELTAIGEVGLDFWYKDVKKDPQKKERQRTVLASFLQLAKELDLPAIIHSRGAWRDCLELAKTVKIKKANFHWYSGPLDVLDEILAEGYYISASPSLAYSPQSREAIAHAPMEQTLIETDSPVYYKNREMDEDGFQAGPKDVLKTLDAYCQLKKLGREEACGCLTHNAQKFFNLQ